MTRKDEYVVELEAQIAEWSARIDGLAAKAQRLTEDARGSVQIQIKEGKAKLEAARQKVDALKSAGTEKYEQAKATVETFWKDAKRLFDKGNSVPAR